MNPRGNRHPRVRINAAELRRELEKVGLDPDYWSHDDITELERRGCSVAQMVQAALQREGLTAARP